MAIVNGLPGSGKSTLAGALSVELALPLLSKDVVKETLFDMLGVADLDWSRKLGAASGEVLWSLLAHCPAGAVLESWFSPHRDRVHVLAGLARAGVAPVVEVWCDVPFETARRRFTERAPARHPGHVEDHNVAEYDCWLAHAHPLGIGEVLRVPTDQPVDVAAVAAWVCDRLEQSTRK